MPLTPPTGFGAATFEDGAITEFLGHGALPESSEVSDPFGFASGALDFDLRLDAGRPREVTSRCRSTTAPPTTAPGCRRRRASPRTYDSGAAGEWTRSLDRVELQLPQRGGGDRADAALDARLHPDQPRRPGAAARLAHLRALLDPRRRDESAALLQMGITQEVRDFLRWYAGYQAPDGKIPCCVDRRGADWTPEHDSNGAFIYAIAEYYRYTHDVGFVHELWPNVVRAVDCLAALRAQRMTARVPRARAGGVLRSPARVDQPRGLLGASGALVLGRLLRAARAQGRGHAGAVVVGDDEHAAHVSPRCATSSATRSSRRSPRTMAQHGIDYMPGSVELGDFDPTSTSIAIVPGGELESLPAAALQRTFERYWEEIELRQQGLWRGEAYSPYELRNVAAFVRLGQRERALGLLDYLMAGRRPAAWNEWAEVVWRDPRPPRFIGDMPHTWVGAGFVQAVRDMLAYEREDDQALVVGAGIAAAWVTSGGVAVRRLPTHWGVLNYSLRGDGPDAVRVRLSGDLVIPPGGIVLASPFDRPIAAATVNGAPVAAVAASTCASTGARPTSSCGTPRRLDIPGMRGRGDAMPRRHRTKGSS